MKNVLLDLLSRITPSRTIINNCIELLKREQVGIKKYGVTLDDAPITHEQALQHLLEEQLDGANYIRKALMTASQAHLDYVLLRRDIEALLPVLDRMKCPDPFDHDVSCYRYAMDDAKEAVKRLLFQFDTAKVQRDLRR